MKEAEQPNAETITNFAFFLNIVRRRLFVMNLKLLHVNHYNSILHFSLL